MDKDAQERLADEKIRLVAQIYNFPYAQFSICVRGEKLMFDEITKHEVSFLQEVLETRRKLPCAYHGTAFAHGMKGRIFGEAGYLLPAMGKEVEDMRFY